MKISLISVFPDIQCFGIRTLSAILKKEGHDVDLLFMAKDYWDKYEESELNELGELTKNSDLIGVSLMTNFWDNSVQITEKLRKTNPTAHIMWGGIHPTVRPEECLGQADSVAIGESEQAVVEVTRKMQKKEPYFDTRGMWFKDGEKIIKNANQALPGSPGSMYANLDDIPFQDYDYKNHYVLVGDNLKKMDLKFMETHLDVFLTMPTRGCPFACTFCINNLFLKMHPHQKPIRKRSVDHIINEIVEAKKSFPFIEKIKFEDDAFFLLNREEITDFSNQYKNKINLPLIILGATPSTLNKEKFTLLVEAGLWEIRMGIQTAGEASKKLFKRPHSNKRVFHATNIVHRFKNKVRAKYDVILDSPWETNQDQIETLDFLSRIKTPWLLNLFSLTFYPGTDLYTKAKAEGIVTDDLNQVYRKNFSGFNKTYLNDIFFLLKDYVEVGLKITPKMIFLMTNPKLRKLKIGPLIYQILRRSYGILYPIMRAKRIIEFSISDIKEGDWSRINRHINQKFRFVRNAFASLF
jgi:anaerobic magnesium-protoporphyrin IX monomethyl ester cyclase